MLPVGFSERMAGAERLRVLVALRLLGLCRIVLEHQGEDDGWPFTVFVFAFLLLSPALRHYLLRHQYL